MSHDLLAPNGICGAAERAAPGARVRLFGTVIDEWVITPTGRGRAKVHAAVVAVADGARSDIVLIVFTVDGRVLDRLRKMGLPWAMAADLVAAADMWKIPVGQVAELHERAKKALHTLVRGAVEGTLPLATDSCPYEPWEAATEAVCRALDTAPVATG